VLVAFSRLYLYLHYPTDVIFSIVLGTAFAWIGNLLAGMIMEKLPKKLK
jgi:undecaprenyl-diphosphatase